MSDTVLKAACPSCGLPDQHVGMSCGFCSHTVPIPAASVLPTGAITVQEVIGYRGFKINRDEDYPRLESPLFDTVFIPGEWMIAECIGHPSVDLPDSDPTKHGPQNPDPELWSPVKGCGGQFAHGCGFYAGRTWNHLIELGYGRYSIDDPHVIAKVQMKGKIIPATNGWRAQKVKPLVVYVPHELWELGRDLKAAYGPHGVEIEMAATLVPPKGGDQAVKWCQKCTAKMPPRTSTCPLCGHNHR